MDTTLNIPERITIGNPFQPKPAPSIYARGCQSRPVGAIPLWGEKDGKRQVVGIKALIVRSHDIQSRIDRHQRHCDGKGKPFQTRQH